MFVRKKWRYLDLFAEWYENKSKLFTKVMKSLGICQMMKKFINSVG